VTVQHTKTVTTIGVFRRVYEYLG